MTDVRELFGLTAEETCLLFSLQYQIVYKDTISTQDTNLNQKKKAWLDKWHESIKIYSKEQGIANVITDSRNLTNLVKKIQSSCSTKISFYLILLECTLFTPYFALDGQKKEDITNLLYFSIILFGIEGSSIQTIGHAEVDIVAANIPTPDKIIAKKFFITLLFII